MPTARPQPFNDPAWLFEPKYDGFRGMLYLGRTRSILVSKRGNVMTRFRDFAEQLRAELPRREVMERPNRLIPHGAPRWWQKWWQSRALLVDYRTEQERESGCREGKGRRRTEVDGSENDGRPL